METNILGREKITTLFFKYSIPSIAGMLFLGVNTVVDGFFVGHYIGVNALAAINIAMPFFSLMIAIGVVIGIGAQSVLGRRLGEGDRQAANDAFATALLLMAGVSSLLAVLAVAFHEQIARLLGASAQLLPFSSVYIGCAGAFLPFLGLMFVLDYALKVTGRPVYSMQVLIVAVVGHMLLNALFIVHLQFGMLGAALAVGLSYTAAFVLAALPFSGKKSSLQAFSGRWRSALAKEMVANGSAEGLSEVGTGVTTFLFNITVMRYAGELGVAAFTAVSYLAFVGNNILIGLADGVGAIVSYNYGLGSLERVKKAFRLAVFSAVAIGTGIFAVLFFYAGDIILLFLDERNAVVLEFAVYGARLYALAFVLSGVNIVASGYFTAVCRPKDAAAIAVSKGVLWIGVCLVALPALFGVRGIWLTVPVAEFLTVILSMTLLRSHFSRECR